MTAQIRFPLTLQALDSDAFKKTFKAEVLSLGASSLPLQQGLRYSSYANGDSLSASILNIEVSDTVINIKAGLFYTGIISGCNCADDPSPIDEYNEYCEVLFTIDRKNAAASVVLID